MGKVLLAALLAGVISALVTAAVLTSLAHGDRAASETRVAEAETRVKEQREALDVALRRIDELQRRVDGEGSAPRRGRAATSGSGGGEGDAPAGPTAPDGTPWVSRAELEKALQEFRPVHAAVGGDLADFGGSPQKKSVEEIARDMGLSATEEATVRQILRESEEELVRCLFGDRPPAEVAAEFKAAETDPDKLEALVQQTITHGFSNVGKIATLEKRTNKRVEDALGKERGKEFLAKPRKPVSDVDLEEILGDTFDD